MSIQINCQKHFHSVHSNSSNSGNSVQPKSWFCSHTIKCQNSSTSNNSVQHKYSFNVKTVPLQTIQLSTSTQFKCTYSPTVKNISTSSHSAQPNNSVQHKHTTSSIQPTDRAPSGATTLGQSRPGSNGNEGAPLTLQNSNITGTSTSDCSVSYPGHSLEGGS